jgi:hypothetical protein
MNTTHTPGPWRTSAKFEPYKPAPTVYSEKGQQIAVCRDAGCTCFTAEDVGNARLIASAPDLLSALEWLADCAADMGADAIQLRDARAAIAKAKGQQPKPQKEL